MAGREEVEQRLQEIDEHLDTLTEHLAPLLGRPISEVLQDLDALDSAKLQVSLAYAMNTFFYLYMRMQGVASAEHPIHRDMERIKSYMDKIKAAEQDTSARARMRINAQAASRFVRNALWEQPAAAAAAPEPEPEA